MHAKRDPNRDGDPGIVRWVMTANLHDRNEPVPVEQGHIIIGASRGMPAQQMIVIDADLAAIVMMANVVVVGLRQRHVNHAENQYADSQNSRA